MQNEIADAIMVLGERVGSGGVELGAIERLARSVDEHGDKVREGLRAVAEAIENTVDSA
jgi:hypothetical protein